MEDDFFSGEDRRNNPPTQICQTHNTTMRSLAKIEQSQETMARDLEAVKLLLSRTVSLEERFLNMAEMIKDIKIYNFDTEKRIDTIENKMYSIEKANDRFMAIFAIIATIIGAVISIYPWGKH